MVEIDDIISYVSPYGRLYLVNSVDRCDHKIACIFHKYGHCNGTRITITSISYLQETHQACHDDVYEPDNLDEQLASIIETTRCLSD